MKSKNLHVSLLCSAILLFLGTKAGYGQEKEKKNTPQMPPAKVVVHTVKSGMLAPHGEFTGSVYFSEVSDLSSEVSGLIDEVLFNEGDLVKKGQVLVRMNAEILEKRIDVERGTFEEALSELEKARIDLKRMENLYKEESVAEQTYDDFRFKVRMLERKTASLESSVERLNLELEKKVIRAPFDGIVTSKSSDRGEWLEPGVKVATVAKGNSYDIVVDVPGRIINFVRKGMEVEIAAGGGTFKGRVFAVIPMGDIATRTFPVKIRVNTKKPLMEGMEARASLPEGEKKRALIVPRDAVISVFGTTAVFTVVDSKARMIPVTISGFQGIEAAVEGEGLKEGMKVVTKGHERLRPEQAVSISKEEK